MMQPLKDLSNLLPSSDASSSQPLQQNLLPSPPLLFPGLPSFPSDSPDSGLSSANSSLLSLFGQQYLSPNPCFPSANSSLLSLFGQYQTSPLSSLGPQRARRSRHDYCKVCEKKICEDNKRSQGPRRHILQFHLGQPLFSCPHCPASSNYDKAHISNHMKRMHSDLGGEVIIVEKSKYADEESKWFQRCFGSSTEKEIKEEIPDTKENDSTAPPVSKSSPAPSTSSISHSIENIISSCQSLPPFPMNMFPYMMYPFLPMLFNPENPEKPKE